MSWKIIIGFISDDDLRRCNVPWEALVLSYCFVLLYSEQHPLPERSENQLPGIQKNKHKNTEIITYITEKLKTFKTP